MGETFVCVYEGTLDVLRIAGRVEHSGEDVVIR